MFTPRRQYAGINKIMNKKRICQTHDGRKNKQHSGKNGAFRFSVVKKNNLYKIFLSL